MKRILIIAITAFTLNVFAQTPPSYIPTNGLIGWFPFNGNANDESGNGNNGVVNGATLSSDRFGTPDSAYAFNGLNSDITAIIDSLPIGNSPRSFSIWFMADTVSNFFNSALTLFNYGVPSTNQRNCAMIWDSVSIFIAEHNDACNACTSSTSVFDPGNLCDSIWHNLIITFSGDTVKCYIDCKLSYYAPKILNTALTPLTIGYSVSTHRDGEPFNGIIDDIGLWNRTLTSTEITQICQADTTTQPCPPISLTFNITNAGAGMNDGAVDVIVTGGQPPYSYSDDGVNFYTSSSFTGLDTGTYQIYVTDSNGCLTQDKFNIITTVGMQTTSSFDSIKVYPNPFSDELIIKLNTGGNISVKLNDITGRRIYLEEYDELSGKQAITINTNVPEGIYYLEIINQRVSYVYKLVKVKSD